MFILHIVILLLLFLLAMLFVLACAEGELGIAVFQALLALCVYGVGWGIGLLPSLPYVARMLV